LSGGSSTNSFRWLPQAMIDRAANDVCPASFEELQIGSDCSRAPGICGPLILRLQAACRQAPNTKTG
jgi:hypothetical protein